MVVTLKMEPTRLDEESKSSPSDIDNGIGITKFLSKPGLRLSERSDDL